MDFTITDEQKALSDAVRELVTRATPELTGDVPVGPQPHDAKVWQQLAEVGALGLPYSEEHGGFGASLVEAVLVAVELGRGRIQSAYADSILAGVLVEELGTDEQKSLIEAIASGESLVIPAINEPMREFSHDAHTVTATQAGDGWTLSGVKEPVRYAADATHVLVTAKAGDTTGVFVVEAPQATGDRLEFAATPATLLGTTADAAAAIDKAINVAIIVLAGESLGAMDAAVPMTAEYLNTRQQFGVPLATFQTLTHRAADMYVSLELARSSVLYGAMALSEDRSDATTASRVKVVVGQSGRHIGQEAIQLHGGIGVTAEYAVGHLTAAITAAEHTYGDTRHHLTRLSAGLRDTGVVEVLHA
ncbi:acyl-CoA dehydrogenase family protein [Kribbia dieselivorans]|uniref:acyl-CoA dehydrogenase family protein n=1 Tax=Kribbia dieselivorans TaxID=331526 RepID=UPI00083805A2|nr:acyl-CoA dehydrogenase family protein [Kribbia dieselivorans]